MKITSNFHIFLFFIIFSGGIVNGCQEREIPVNTLSKKEIKEGWQLLFDGKSTVNWRGYNQPDFSKSGWVIKDDAMFCQQPSAVDIITMKKYSNFKLKLDWKVNKAANSGVLYLVTELPNEDAYLNAPEMQIIDGANWPEEWDILGPDQLSGSAYDLVAADPQTVKPYGEWNQICIVVSEGMVEHWQNGVKVVTYSLWTPEWEKMVMDSKFSEYPEFLNMSKEGHIALQGHGGGVWFRNIKIVEL